MPRIFDWPEPTRIIDDPPRPELYNIADDPLEEHDLWDEHPQRGAKLLNDLENWFDEVEAERRTIPMTNGSGFDGTPELTLSVRDAPFRASKVANVAQW